MRIEHSFFSAQIKSSRRRKQFRRRRRNLGWYRPGFELLEQRQLLAANWSNPLFAIDVNDDGSVAPVDVLVVINDLNESGARPLTGPFDNESTAGYIDVNGDDSVSPVDALIVINLLNSPPLALPIDLRLTDDTGDSAVDTITNSPRVEGQATGLGAALSSARLRVNREAVVDLSFDSNGRFTLTENTLQSLQDGEVKISVLFEDANGLVGLRASLYPRSVSGN